MRAPAWERRAAAPKGGNGVADRLVVAADLPFEGPLWERLEKAAAPDRIVRVKRSDRPAFVDALRDAEVALLAADVDDDVLAARKLKWIHVNMAGATKSARPEVFERGIILTSSAGRSAPALAEHAMLYMLALGTNLRGFEAAQRAHRWGGVEGWRDLRALFGHTLGIIGVGFSGRELAVRAKAFEMKVLGYRRRDGAVPPGIDRMYSSDRGETIDPILEQADFIAMTINLSDATRHMIGRRELAKMKPRAILINLSRGGVIDEDALIDALYERRIGGAGLDVFDVEPLPPESRLWDAPNTMISPHFSAPVHDRLERNLAIIEQNLARYRARQSMLNVLTSEDVYTVE